jgi:hypothetical protein
MNIGVGVLKHPPYSPDIVACDYWLFVCVKEHLLCWQFELEDNINTAVTPFLHHLSKNKYRAATDRSPHRWEKCVDSAGDYTELRTYV